MIMRQRAITGFGITLLFVLGFAIFFFLNFKTVVVSGKSMEETFHDGDRLLAGRAYWLIGAIRVKDVVVLKSEGGSGYIIKRVAYMSGQTVDYVNIPDSWNLGQGDFVVPAGDIYVLGDNSAVSEDSRKFGPVPQKDVMGKVIRMPESWGTLLGIVTAALIAIVVLTFIVSAFIDSRRKPAPKPPPDPASDPVD
jgi:signal peptidase I